MKTMCAKMGDNIFQGIINMNEAYRERIMKTTTYKAAQQSYDRQEHPDYWNDDEDESRLEWDELSDAGRQRRMERNYEEADRRRKELKEDALMRSIKRLPGDHDGWPSDEQMEYFKRGGR
jgi:cysteinyl-tRNA synthetase